MPFLIIVFFLVCNHSVYAEKDPAFRFEGNATPNFFDIQKEFYKQYANEKKVFNSTLENDSYKEGMLYQFRKWEWFWKQIVLPDGEFPQPMILQDMYQKELRRSNNSKSEKTLQLKPNWKNLGPTNIPRGGGAGRVNGVYTPPGQNQIMWAAAAGGGAWLPAGRANAVGQDGAHLSADPAAGRWPLDLSGD